MAKKKNIPDVMPDLFSDLTEADGNTQSAEQEPSEPQDSVPEAGLEPAHPKVKDFKSFASTDFAIRAELCRTEHLSALK